MSGAGGKHLPLGNTGELGTPPRPGHSAEPHGRSQEGGLLKTPPESSSGFLEMNSIVVSFSRSKFSLFAHRGDTGLKGEVLSGRTQEDSVLWDPILFLKN